MVSSIRFDLEGEFVAADADVVPIGEVGAGMHSLALHQYTIG